MTGDTNETTQTPNLKDFFFYGQWKGASDSVSGWGSSMEYTSVFRPQLEGILKSMGVKTFLDAPCGDFNWMKTIKYDGKYIGMDIVDKVIEENTSNFGREDRIFMSGDITADQLPKADLMMVRDCLFHLPFFSIAGFFDNFLRSGIPHVLLTTHFNKQNKDVERPGLCRRLNLMRPPFNLPEPGDDLKLRDHPDGSPKRYMFLWNREQVAKAVDEGMVESLRA